MEKGCWSPFPDRGMSLNVGRGAFGGPGGGSAGNEGADDEDAENEGREGCQDDVDVANDGGLVWKEV